MDLWNTNDYLRLLKGFLEVAYFLLTGHVRLELKIEKTKSDEDLDVLFGDDATIE